MPMITNDFGNRCYHGPQPPPGDGVYRYHFGLFALRKILCRDASKFTHGWNELGIRPQQSSWPSPAHSAGGAARASEPSLLRNVSGDRALYDGKHLR